MYRTKYLVIVVVLVLGVLCGLLLGRVAFAPTASSVMGAAGDIAYFAEQQESYATVIGSSESPESDIRATIIAELQGYLAGKNVAAEERELEAYIAERTAYTTDEQELTPEGLPESFEPCVSTATTTAGVLADCAGSLTEAEVMIEQNATSTVGE